MSVVYRVRSSSGLIPLRQRGFGNEGGRRPRGGRLRYPDVVYVYLLLVKRGSVSSPCRPKACCGCEMGRETNLNLYRLKLDRLPLGSKRHHILSRYGALSSNPFLKVIESKSKHRLAGVSALYTHTRTRVDSKTHDKRTNTYSENRELSTCRRWPVWAINTCVCVAMTLAVHPSVTERQGEQLESRPRRGEPAVNSSGALSWCVRTGSGRD